MWIVKSQSHIGYAMTFVVLSIVMSRIDCHKGATFVKIMQVIMSHDMWSTQCIDCYFRTYVDHIRKAVTGEIDYLCLGLINPESRVTFHLAREHGFSQIVGHIMQTTSEYRPHPNIDHIRI